MPIFHARVCCLIFRIQFIWLSRSRRFETRKICEKQEIFVCSEGGEVSARSPFTIDRKSVCLHAESYKMSQNLVVVQAASGLLGGHVVKDLLDNGFRVRAIVRAGSSKDKLSMLQNLKKQFEQQLEIETLSNLSDLNEYDRFYRGTRL